MAECAGCGAAATMRCPKCLVLNIDVGSRFCSQECFKGKWDTHKALHKGVAAALGGGKLQGDGSCPVPGFEYAGPLRPWPQSPKRLVPPHIPRPDYADHPTGTSLSEQGSRVNREIRELSAAELDKMRVACRLGREVLDEAAKIVRPGITCDEIDRVVHEACVVRNAYPSPLNYYQFPKSCCTSVNEVICHGIPDGYVLKDGDIVNVDVSLYHNGYHADLNETYLVGKVDDDSVRLVKATYDSLMAAIAACKPGMKYRDIGEVITKSVAPHKFQVNRTYCGHGVNNLFHTAPNIPHYSKNKAIGTMKAGHVFTIEPMVNAGTHHDKIWPDDWTVTTTDGKRSAQFEHTMIVTDTGVEVITARTAASPAGPAWFETYLAQQMAGKEATAAAAAAELLASP